MQAICFITSLKSNCLRLLKLWGSKPYHSNWFFLRPEIKKTSASKTAWAPAPKSSNQKIANETIKWFHLQTYDYTIEKNASCHVPLHNERKNLHAAWTMRACTATSIDPTTRTSNKMPKGEIVDDYFVWDCLFDDKQKNIEQIKARSHAVRHMSLKIKACISQIELATPKLARLCMLL